MHDDAHDAHDAHDDVRSWERKVIPALLGLLLVCFTTWAAVVWDSGQQVVRELRASRIEDAQNRLVMERRITILEQQIVWLNERQNWILEDLRRQVVP